VLPRSTPSAQGVDPRALLDLVEALDADPETELHSVMVLRHGHVVAEGWWAPHEPGRARLVYSLSKSFTSTALAFAVAEGLLGLDETVLSHFPELDAEVTDPRSRATTLRHLAMMASGHDRDMWQEALAGDHTEPVRGFLTVPPDAEPGTLFAYNQPCTYTVAAAIQRAAGMSLVDYLRPRLLDPLGIGEVGWQAGPPGRQLGFTGFFARTEDIARLGQLYLQRGAWEGRQLLDPSYVDLATAKHVDTAQQQDNPDWQQGYGFQFWQSRHGYRGDGAFGQFCVVLPEQDVVVAMTAGTENMQAVLDHVWAHLVPGLGRTVEDPDTEAALTARLASLALAPCVADADPEPGTYAVSGEDAAATSVVRLEVGDREVTLVEDGDAVTFPIGVGSWARSVRRTARGDEIAVAASGGRTSQETRLEVLFVETPHRLDIVCDPATGTAHVAWRIQPLHEGALRTLCLPRPAAG